MMQLNPVPSAEWQAEYDALMRDDWLRKKLDRQTRIDEHHAYLANRCPEFVGLEPGVVLDIGPGAGELLEIARLHGHDVLGVDAEVGQGGMGDAYLRACQLMTERQKIPVEYVGFHKWLRSGLRELVGKAALINSRGSIEQCHHELMSGRPHDEHHRADQLDWIQDGLSKSELLHTFSVFSWLLRPGGILLIHANGTRSAESQAWYDDTVRWCEKFAGLELIEQDGLRFHKWMRPRD